jgi:hypothetical protein
VAAPGVPLEGELDDRGRLDQTSGARYLGLQRVTCPIAHDVLKLGEAVAPRNLRLWVFSGLDSRQPVDEYADHCSTCTTTAEA